MKKLISYLIAFAVLTSFLWVRYLPKPKEDKRDTYPTEQEIQKLNR